MARPNLRSGPLVALVVALSLGSGWVGAPSEAAAAEARLPAWNGGVSLYREGVFTTQKSWLWCTAADVQIIRNIVKRGTDHSTSGQRRYYNWMRARNKYALPQSAGVDPQGWTAGLRHFVDDRYRLVASKTFDAALRSAVTNLRRTNLPVAVTVSHGGHGWVLTGFTATADPLTTSSFKVTSVRVVGPLFGLQSRNGYDMRPNTKLTTAQFRRYFTPWKYAPKKMIWDGLYVSIQPIAAKAAPAATPKPAVRSPSPALSPSPSANPSLAPTPGPTLAPSLAPTAAPTVSSAPIAVAEAWTGPAVTEAPAQTASSAVATVMAPMILLTVAVLAVIGGIAGWQVGVRRRRPPS
jgi:hypothetical protein